MKMICPVCGEVIPAADIELARGLCLCRACNEVVALPSVIDEDHREGNAAFVAHEIAKMPLSAYRPSSLTVSETRMTGRTRLIVTPSRVPALLALLFALVWSSLLVYSIGFVRSDYSAALGLLRYWLPLLHLAAGLVFLHRALCMLVNRTTLLLGPVRFTLQHRPLPDRGALDEPARNIRCFVEEEQISRGHQDRWFQKTVTWAVVMLTRDGRSTRLALDLPERDHARYLALRLNRALDELHATQTEGRAPALMLAEEP